MSFGKFVPLLNRVLVKKFVPEIDPSKSLLLQKSANMFYATVIETGPGLTRDNGQTIELSVKKGDIVKIPESGGIRLKFKG